MKTLALAVSLAITSVMASAATVTITDFTAGNIAPFGSTWLWDSQSRNLGVYSSNTNADYLYQTYGVLDHKDIAGTTYLQLTAQWTPAGGGNPPDGHFFIDLINNGTLLARANYTYGQFDSGMVTVSAPLAWELSVPTTFMDQWQLVGNGNSSAAFGDFTLTNMVATNAVPEPSTCAMALAAIACGGFSIWRRRRNRRRTKSGRCPAAIRTLAIIAMGMVCFSMRTADAAPSLADITWGSATNISGGSDVDTTGTLVYAYNFGSSSSATMRTINGVTFQPFVVPNTLSNSATTGSVTITENNGYLSSDLDVGSGTTAPFSALSSDYRSVLSSEVYSSNFANIRVDLGGLTPGTEYLLQWWTNDSAMTPYVPGFPRYLFENTFSSGAVSSVTLDSNTTNVIGGLGQYVIGTFTASDTTASFTLTGSGTGIDQLPLLNALQVRAVPEPATFAIALAGLACVCHSMWRRRKPA